MKTKLLSFGLLISSVSQAALLTFRFETTMDTTAYGGAANTPLSVLYTFDSTAPNGSGPGAVDSTSGSYAMLNLEIRLGDQFTSASGAGMSNGISLFNDTGPYIEDGYEALSVGPFSGQIFGRDIHYFVFQLTDKNHTMFSDTSLPLSPDFAAAADYQHVGFYFPDLTSFSLVEFAAMPAEQRTPFTLNLVPEPSSLMLILSGGVFLAVRSARHHRKHSGLARA
jgi:hypothetical protein